MGEGEIEKRDWSRNYLIFSEKNELRFFPSHVHCAIDWGRHWNYALYEVWIWFNCTILGAYAQTYMCYFVIGSGCRGSKRLYPIPIPIPILSTCLSLSLRYIRRLKCDRGFERLFGANIAFNQSQYFNRLVWKCVERVWIIQNKNQ